MLLSSHRTCHFLAQPTFLSFIIRMIFNEKYKSWSSSLCIFLQFPVTLSILRLRSYQINDDVKCCKKFAGRYTEIQCDLQTSSFFWVVTLVHLTQCRHTMKYFAAQMFWHCQLALTIAAFSPTGVNLFRWENMLSALLKVHVRQTRFDILECDVREESIDRLPTVESECIAWLSNVQGDTKKRELLKNPTKIEEIQKKKKLLTEIEPLQLAF